MWAYNEVTQSDGYYPVTGLISHNDPSVVKITIDRETLTTTLEHPFYTLEDGWQKVSELEVGEHIRRSDGSYGKVNSVQVEQDPQRMYNLTVDQAHSFYVGNEHWLTHNQCPIFGNLQKGTSLAHNAKMLEIAEQLAKSGRYEEVWMDTRVNISTRGQVLGKTEPDVLGLNFTNKMAHVVEIPSPSQMLKNGQFTGNLLFSISRTKNAFVNSGWSIIVEIIRP